MSKTLTIEFRRDVVAVRRFTDTYISEVASEFEISESRLER